MSTPSSAGDIGEHGIIDLIRSRVGQAPGWVLVGIGDDAAVVEPARNQVDVLTIDALVEGVHFDRAFAPPASIGHRSLAVNLSDLAAMGALPRAALLSLVLPEALPASDIEEIVDGFLALAGQYSVALVGGNVSRSPGGLVVDVTLMGACRRRRVLLRRGARPGDDLWVSGTLGAATAGLECLQLGGLNAPETMTACVERYLRPNPRVRLGRSLAGNRVTTSCIDLSDGLADGIRQIAEANGVGAVLDGGALPIDPSARRWFEAGGRDAIECTLGGGDDYELLFTASPKLRARVGSIARAEGPLARIGTVTSDTRLLVDVDRERRPLPHGYRHFR